jgi:SAM-dependent methyltransferase
MAKYRRALDMDRWKTDARIARRGFNHAYDSVVEDGNGEDFFLSLVDEALGDDLDLLDVGCGHGDLTIELAGRCRSAVGVDRSPGFVELARELAAERGASNARFEVAELAGVDEGDRPAGGPLPLAGGSVDLVVDRRGPALARFLDDLWRRVARPGCVVLGMHPAGGPPPPRWADELPTFRHRFDAIDAAVVGSWVVEPVRRLGLEDGLRLWWLDVPEHLPGPRALYDRLRFDGAPSFDDVSDELGGVFDRQAVGERGVSLRHQRLVFRLELP